ncbi:MAG: protein-L-isoaspartate(D-aspartate) O-methyltransferase [Lentisphaerae bacterium]|nr:protein-L-isoaspartate(D-aspartate) O-methyltransferase [Lentisphaerota bacterium]
MGGSQPEDWAARRAAMVAQLRAYRIQDEAVLAAMQQIARHRFIPESFRHRADPYGDHPCPIGFGQTISQPFIVAYMTERMHVQPGEQVLEIGTGSGYQAAVLAALGARVYSVEIVPELAAHAREALDAEGYASVQVRVGNGYQGWEARAPFDVIIVTCAPEQIPDALVAQLREGGRMIVPVGEQFQRLVILRKRAGDLEQEQDLMVRFVPMVHGRGKDADDGTP